MTLEQAGEREFPIPWQWLVANGLDIEHLSAVHDRDLLEPPVLTIDGTRELTVRYRTRPQRAGLSDRVMARLAPDGVLGTIRTLGGSMMLVEARLGRHETFILMSFAPQLARTRFHRKAQPQHHQQHRRTAEGVQSWAVLCAPQ